MAFRLDSCKNASVFGLLVLASILAATEDASAQTDRPTVVAVFDIHNQGSPLSKPIVGRLGDYLAGRLAMCNLYRLAPRDQLRKEIARQRTQSHQDCYDQSCQIELGAQIAADKSLSTSIIKIGNICEVTSSLYDVRSETTVLGASQEGKCTEEAIRKSLLSVVSQLCRNQSEKLDSGFTQQPSSLTDHQKEIPASSTGVRAGGQVPYGSNLNGVSGSDLLRRIPVDVLLIPTQAFPSIPPSITERVHGNFEGLLTIDSSIRTINTKSQFAAEMQWYASTGRFADPGFVQRATAAGQSVSADVILFTYVSRTGNEFQIDVFGFDVPQATFRHLAEARIALDFGDGLVQILNLEASISKILTSDMTHWNSLPTVTGIPSIYQYKR